MLIYAIVLIVLMIFNNSPLKKRMVEKKNMREAVKIQKEAQ